MALTFLPMAILPLTFLPMAILPLTFLPMAILPMAFLPTFVQSTLIFFALTFSTVEKSIPIGKNEKSEILSLEHKSRVTQAAIRECTFEQ